MLPLEKCRLYAFVDTAYLRGRDPVTVTRQLCEGGADLIQLRAKSSTVEEVRQLALGMMPVTRGANVGLVINDHLGLAQEIGADFCHLGQEDYEQMRISESGFRNVTKEVRVGLSTHAPDQARRAVGAGADYVAVGPVYPTATKPGAKPVTLDYVRWAAQNLAIPWFAIGGIHLTNLEQVLAAGARRICVVSAILNAPNVARACEAFRKRLG
jgi:thiamine-phosphate pyrophosphorylase